MLNRHQKRALLLQAGRGAVAVVVMLQASALVAQDRSQESLSQVADAIVVTGSLIRSDMAAQGTPLEAITAREIETIGTGDAGELLRQWPGVVAASGSAMNNGNVGSSFVNLRGLGPGRNLVLLDGNRLTPSGISGIFDLDNLPPALMERVDILTGGASATYGADAISGVVNFVTRKNFSGLELAATNGITQKGDGHEYRLDLTAGANFAGGRGNVVVAASYLNSDSVTQGDRDFSFYSIDSRTGQRGGSQVGVPALMSGVSDAGADFIAYGCGPGGVACATNVQGIRQIAPDGSGFSPYELYAPYNTNPWNLFRTPFERVNAYATGRYEISDAVELRVRGLYSHNQVQSEVAPSGIFGSIFYVPLNNPYLTDSMRASLCSYDLNPGPGYLAAYTPAECAAAATATGPTDPNFRYTIAGLGRRAAEAGPRITRFTTDYFDVEGGLGGQLSSSVRWDASLSYGESRKDMLQTGYWRDSRVQQSLLSGPGGCFDPKDGCVPVNFFGPEGSITPEMNAFLLGEATAKSFTSLLQGKALLSGDTGLVVPFTTAPISFAFGGEYRRYRASERPDAVSQSGDLGGMAGGSPAVAGGYSVREAIAEIQVPLVEDVPGVERLTIGGGLRYSDTRINAAGNPNHDAWTWKAEASWLVGSGVEVRGSAAHAVRAPNISELFFPRTTSVTTLAIDPCAGAAPIGNANLLAVCLAQGAGMGQIGGIQQPTSSVVNATSAGNTSLRPETADTWTAGLAFSPETLRGFSASVDYYNIRVKSAIGTLSPGDAIADCFGNLGAASATDPACTLIQRNPATGGLEGNAGGLWLPMANLGRLKVDGLDFTVRQQVKLGSAASLALDFQGTWTRNSSFEVENGASSRECAGYYSSNCVSLQPKFSFRQRTTLSVRDFDLSLGWRYIGGSEFEPRQFEEELAMANALGCVDAAGSDPYGCVVDKPFRKIGGAHYFDLAARAGVHQNLELWLRVANLFNRQPPMVGDTVGNTSYNSGNTYPAVYDALGRRFSVTARLRF